MPRCQFPGSKNRFPPSTYLLDSNSSGESTVNFFNILPLVTATIADAVCAIKSERNALRRINFHLICASTHRQLAAVSLTHALTDEFSAKVSITNSLHCSSIVLPLQQARQTTDTQWKNMGFAAWLPYLGPQTSGSKTFDSFSISMVEKNVK